MPETEEQSVSVREQVELVRRVLRKRWWLIAVVAVVAGAAAFGTTKLLSPIYEASTSVRIVRERGLAEATPRGADYSGRTLQAEANWFTSRQVVEQVVRRLALAESRPGSLLEAGMAKAENALRRLLNRPVPEDAGFNEIVGRLCEKSIKVKELAGSNVLEIRVNWHDPEMAMRIANTLVDVFIEQFQEFSRGRARQNRTYLEQQVQLVATQLKESENNLVEFQKKTGIVSPDDKQVGLPSQAELQGLMVEKRQVELQNASAHAELEQTDGRQATGNAGTQESNEALRSALRNPTSLLRTLMSQVVIKETDAARENQTYTDEHPAGSRTLKQLEGLKERLREELKRLGADPALTADDALLIAQEEEQKARVSENMSAQLQVERVSLAVRTKLYEDQLTRLEAEIAEAEKETQKLPDELQQYMTLTREKRVNEELYTILCQRLAGAQVDEQSELCDIRVFDLARLPLKPLKPKPALLTVLGTFMGLLLGICVAFSIEYLDDSLRTTQEVQSYLGLPVLAEIPKVRVRNKLVSAKKTPELVGPM